jgi:hypothetical protein
MLPISRSLACATLLLAAHPAAARAQAWLDSLRVAETPRYVVYAPTDADLLQARGELDHAVAAFARHFGGPPPRIAVLLTDRNPPRDFEAAFHRRGLRVLAWLTDRGWDAQHAGMEGGRPHSEARILPHEACHAFLSAHVDARQGRPLPGGGPRTRTTHYGHPALPDWLDEAAAVLCEHADDRARREARMAERLDARIPLAEFLTMAHPLSGAFAVRTGPGAPAPRGVPGEASAPPAPGTYMGAMTFQNVLTPDAAVRATTFYAQALSFTRFLSERYGSGAVGRVVEGVADGRPVGEALASIGAPADTARLEAAWVQWVRGRQP